MKRGRVSIPKNDPRETVVRGTVTPPLLIEAGRVWRLGPGHPGIRFLTHADVCQILVG
jgi:hypothetical protein